MNKNLLTNSFVIVICSMDNFLINVNLTYLHLYDYRIVMSSTTKYNNFYFDIQRNKAK